MEYEGENVVGKFPLPSMDRRGIRMPPLFIEDDTRRKMPIVTVVCNIIVSVTAKCDDRGAYTFPDVNKAGIGMKY